jgi:hypothetical protein
MGLFSRRSAGYLVVATALALTLTGPPLAQSQGQEVTIRDEKQLVESLRSGGYVIVVRHGATFSDQTKPHFGLRAGRRPPSRTIVGENGCGPFPANRSQTLLD